MVKKLRDWLKEIYFWVSLLRDVSFWTVLVPILISTIIGIGAIFKNLPWPIVVTIFITSFAGILLIIYLITYIITQLLSRNKFKKSNIQIDSESNTQNISYSISEQLTSSLLQGHHFRISELARETVEVRDRIFENCYIYGPAIIILRGTIAVDCTFKGGSNVETILIEIAPNRTIVGPIGIFNCTFRKCTFINIGIVGTAEDLKVIRDALSN